MVRQRAGRFRRQQSRLAYFRGPALTCPVQLKGCGMTVAALAGVMTTVFRVRWVLTVYFLELAVRIVLLSAIFMRPGARPRARALLPGSGASRG
jgi:hypothetical protein